MASAQGTRIGFGALLIALATGFAAVGAWQTNQALDREAVAAFESARTAVGEAAGERAAAATDLATAVDAAVQTRSSGVALLGVADAGLLADPAVLTRLTAAIATLDAAAGFEVGADGVATAQDAPALAAAPEIDAPVGRDALLQAAPGVAALAEPLTAEAGRLAARADRIDAAVAGATTAIGEVVASAHAKGIATPAPELASPETRDAYSAAVAALAHPARGADPAVLVAAVRDAWAAAVASSDAAARALDPADVQPTYIDGILIVNKTYGIPSWFGDGLTAETQAAFESMRAEAASLGLSLVISSGFRSYWSQQAIYDRYVAADGQAEADRYSARPGHSEHQTGLAFDLNTIDEAFGYTPEGQWVRDNAHRFGFIVRYPPGKEAVTGYIWEPWHLRYLGVDAATRVVQSGLSLEEYLGVTSSYG